MTASTDQTSAVTDMRRAFEHTRALLSSLKPIADEDEDTMPGAEYEPGPEDLTMTMPAGSKKEDRR